MRRHSENVILYQCLKPIPMECFKATTAMMSMCTNHMLPIMSNKHTLKTNKSTFLTNILKRWTNKRKGIHQNLEPRLSPKPSASQPAGFEAFDPQVERRALETLRTLCQEVLGRISQLPPAEAAEPPTQKVLGDVG